MFNCENEEKTLDSLCSAYHCGRDQLEKFFRSANFDITNSTLSDYPFWYLANSLFKTQPVLHEVCLFHTANVLPNVTFSNGLHPLTENYFDEICNFLLQNAPNSYIRSSLLSSIESTKSVQIFGRGTYGYVAKQFCIDSNHRSFPAFVMDIFNDASLGEVDRRYYQQFFKTKIVSFRHIFAKGRELERRKVIDIALTYANNIFNKVGNSGVDQPNNECSLDMMGSVVPSENILKIEPMDG